MAATGQESPQKTKREAQSQAQAINPQSPVTKHSHNQTQAQATPAQDNPNASTTGFTDFDPEEYSLRKRLPRKYSKQKNHLYVNRKTNFKAQSVRAQKLLDSGFKEIFIHGLGAAVNRAINMGLQIKQRSHGSMDLAVNTTTMELIDDFEPETDEQEPRSQIRHNNAIHIKLYRLDPLAKFDNSGKDSKDTASKN